MTVVIDASVLLDDVTARSHPLNPIIRQHELVAPMLLDLEVANALRRAVRARILDPEEAQARLRQLLGTAGLERFGHAELMECIWRLRDNFTAYDASYIALAERLAIPLVTTDAPLARSIRASGVCEVIAPE